MQHRKDYDGLVGCAEIDGIRESVKQCTSNISDHCGELEWPVTDAYQRPIYVAEKPVGEPRAFGLIPPCGILKIGLGEWPNDEAASHAVQWLLSNFWRRRC
jgi:hypothetical protein